MRRGDLINGVICFLSALGLSLLAYPWSTYVAYRVPWQKTAASYVVASLITSALCSFIPSYVIGRQVSGVAAAVGWRRVFRFGMVAILGVIVMVAMFSGLGFSWNVPGTRVRGIFFAEFKFVWFAYRVGVPVSLIATGLFWWANRRT